MEDSTTATVETTSEELINKSSRSNWVEKHAELITKLEAEYQQPQGVQDETLARRYYSFNSAGLNLLVPKDATSEVLEDSYVHTIPLAPKWLVGACNVRGDILPIIDLNQILNKQKTELITKQNIILMIGSAEKAIGILLSKLPKAIQFKKDEQATKFIKSPKILKPFISIAYKNNHNYWLCVDFLALISSFKSK